MNDCKMLAAMCEKQEKEFQFAHFSREEALQFGLKLHENAKKHADPVAIEITIGEVTVFRYFADGVAPDCTLWLDRKRAAVRLMDMSSLRFAAWLECTGQTLESRGLAPDGYACCGGGFPLTLRGTGVVGSICVSGLPNHLDDHQLIIDTLAEWFA